VTFPTRPIAVEQALAEFLLQREQDPELDPDAIAATLPATMRPGFAAEVNALLACDAWLPPPRASTPVDEPTDADATVRLGPFRLLRRLGQGASATVHAAIDERDGADATPVALKVLHAASPSCDPRTGCHREAELLARLDHPAIVRLRQATTVLGRPALVLDLIRGATLRELLHARTEPSHPRHAFAASWLDRPANVVEFVRRLVHALAHAHARGVVHRDLKPANILVDDSGAPTIVDFGLARDTTVATTDGVDGDGDVLGTPLYMAPEQLAGLPAGPGADLFAIGLLLQECLTGAPARGPAGDPRQLPRGLRRIVQRCCAQRPADRWSGATELGDALHRWRRFERWRTAARAGLRAAPLRRFAAASIACVMSCFGLVARGVIDANAAAGLDARALRQVRAEACRAIDATGLEQLDAKE